MKPLNQSIYDQEKRRRASEIRRVVLPFQPAVGEQNEDVLRTNAPHESDSFESAPQITLNLGSGE